MDRDTLSRKKEAIRRRVIEAKYPRRGEADFTSDPDHNPIILEDCPECRGRGEVCEESEGIAALDVCQACEGRGTTGRLTRYFEVDPAAPSKATPSNGWVTCPWCNRRFALHDPRAWTGLRHLTCGNRIELCEP